MFPKRESMSFCVEKRCVGNIFAPFGINFPLLFPGKS